MARKTIASLEAKISELELAINSRDVKIESLEARNDEAHQGLLDALKKRTDEVLTLKSACVHFKEARDRLAGHLEAYLAKEDASLDPIVEAPMYEGDRPIRTPRTMDRPLAMTSVPMKRVLVSSRDTYGVGPDKHFESVPMDWENIGL